MLLVRPQKKSSKTVSCNIAVQKNLEQGSGVSCLGQSTTTTFIDICTTKSVPKLKYISIQ